MAALPKGLRPQLSSSFVNNAIPTAPISAPLTFHRCAKPSKNRTFSRPISTSRVVGDGGVVEIRAKGGDLNSLLKRYSFGLKACAMEGSLSGGKAIHGNIIRSGVDPDDHLWVSLLLVYGKCGNPKLARKVFDQMPKKKIVAWTTLIGRVTAESDASEGARMFSQMCREGIVPNKHVMAAGLKACCACRDSGLGRQLHGVAAKLGFLSDLCVGSGLVELYVSCREVGLAEKVFFDLPKKNDVCLVSLLRGHSQVESKGVGAWNLFGQIVDMETRLSKHVLSAVLKCCAGLTDGRCGKMVHSLVIKIGLETHVIIGTTLVDMYSKCRSPMDAYKAFLRIKDQDVVAWTSIISCLEQHVFASEAAMLFMEMRRRGIEPNQYTLASLAGVASGLQDLAYGRGIHACVIKLGFQGNNIVGNAMVSMYMKAGAVREGCMVFHHMKDRDTISWNSLLSGFHSGSTCEDAFQFFNQMLCENFRPNKYTYVSILRTCTSNLDVNFGAQVHAHIMKEDLGGDQFIGTGLIDMYASSGHLKSADLIFSGLKERDVFTWTVMITGYSQMDQGEEAIKYFREMRRENIDPNEFTFASCLSACSNLAALCTGKQIHSQITKMGLADKFVSSALVDMYGKSGSLRDAEGVFLDLATRDTVLWNTIICCYSQHGYGEKALKAFHRMEEDGVKPDEITFIGVLSACSHVGLIDDGRKYFDSMRPNYAITPTIEHHACMVDILGRAGRLEEAKSFIEKMTLPPNALIWQTILGACRMHGNIAFGEKAAEKLLLLDPHTDSTYIILSNMYASAKRWNDVARIRSLMSSQGVKKEPGCSWIEIAEQVHVFLPNDVSHPKIKEIHSKLEELTREITSAGYVPNIDSVLHDTDDADKLRSLLHHSERLALAYGLLSLKAGATIRIYKNLRICDDCHIAIKYISKVTGRKIIIRDISRFHHFQNGNCSCHDYW